VAISPGTSIGRYHIIAELGRGGMAVVYRAYDTRLDCEVAVKFIRRDSFAPEMLEGVLQRFQREAKALAQLNHPNIVKVTDYGEHENTPYLVMPFLNGGTLKNRCGTPLPAWEAARLLLPVARALDYAHQRGILHRDVKPSNILLTDSGEPMLCDFGIARLLAAGEGQTLTATGVGIGTPEYMAPEQGLGQPQPASDQYALGIVLYELLTGRRPFNADTPIAVLLKQVNDPLPPPRQYVPDLSQAAERVLFTALSKQPEHRFEDMAAFARALENLLQPTTLEIHAPEEIQGGLVTMMPTPPLEIPTPDLNEPTWYGGHQASDDSLPSIPESAEQALDEPGDTGQSTSTSKVRWPVWIAALTGVVVLIVFIVLWAIGNPTQENPGASTIAVAGVALQQATETPSATRAVDTATPSITPVPTNTPTSTITPMPTLPPVIGPNHIPQVVRELSGHENIIIGLFISSDNEFLTSVSMDSTIKKWRIDNGSLISSKQIDGSLMIGPVAFSSNGELLAAVNRENSNISLWSVDDTTLIRTIDLPDVRTIFDLSISPDDTTLAIGSSPGTKIVKLADGTILKSLFIEHTYCVAFSPTGNTLVSGGYLSKLKLWQTMDWQQLGSLLRGKGYYINWVVFSPDSRVVAVSSDDLRFFSVEEQKMIAKFDLEVNELIYSPNGEFLALITPPTVSLFHYDSGTTFASLTHNSEAEYSSKIAFSPDGRVLASTSGNKIMIWMASE
jgi:serine/threonine protein kinase